MCVSIYFIKEKFFVWKDIAVAGDLEEDQVVVLMVEDQEVALIAEAQILMRCLMQFVMSVVKTAKFLSNLQQINLFIVVIVLRKKVETEIGIVEVEVAEAEVILTL